MTNIYIQIGENVPDFIMEVFDPNKNDFTELYRR